MANPSPITESGDIPAFTVMRLPLWSNLSLNKAALLSCNPSDPDSISQSIEDLSRITIHTRDGRKECVKAEFLNRSQSRRSWIWEYGRY